MRLKKSELKHLKKKCEELWRTEKEKKLPLFQSFTNFFYFFFIFLNGLFSSFSDLSSSSCIRDVFFEIFAQQRRFYYHDFTTTTALLCFFLKNFVVKISSLFFWVKMGQLTPMLAGFYIETKRSDSANLFS